MLLLLFILELTFFFLSNVAALNIFVQSNTVVGQPSLVLWKREPSDGNGPLVFDLRFANPDNKDVGLALANIRAPPSTQSGTVQVVFKSPSSYRLMAVRGPGPNFIQMGQSGQVNAFQVQTSSIPVPTTTSVNILPTSTSQPGPVPSATSSPALKSTAPTGSTVTHHRKKNIGAFIGGTLGGVTFLGLLAVLGIMFHRRQPKENTRRWTFHRDKMIRPPVVDICRDSTRRRPSTRPATTLSLLTLDRQMTESSIYSQFSSREDQRLPNDDILSKYPIVMMASPTKPRMAYPRSRSRPLPERPEPLRPLPQPPEQDDEAVQIDRNWMTELEKNKGPTQHIILDDSGWRKTLSWF